MKKCPKCNVNVLNNRLTCPLCHMVLEEATVGDNNYQAYPHYNPPLEENHLTKKIIMFLGIISIIISIVVNYVTFNKDNPVYWSSIVVAAIILTLVILLVSILSHFSITLKILAPMVFTELLVLTIEINTKNYWSIYYLVPFLIIAFLLTIFILHLSLKARGKELVVDLLVSDIIAFILSIILLIRKINVQWTYLTLLTFSIIIFLIIFFFLGKTLKAELSKKMHI